METKIKITGDFDIDKDVFQIELLPNMIFFHEFGSRIYLLELSFFIVRFRFWFGKTKDVWNIARGNLFSFIF